MEQSPSWEANRFLVSQEISLILWNPKASSSRQPQRALILSQLKPVHILPAQTASLHRTLRHFGATFPKTSFGDPREIVVLTNENSELQRRMPNIPRNVAGIFVPQLAIRRHQRLVVCPFRYSVLKATVFVLRVSPGRGSSRYAVILGALWLGNPV